MQLFQPLLQGGRCLAIANESGGNQGKPAPFALKDTCLEALVRIMQKDNHVFRALWKSKAVRVSKKSRINPAVTSSDDAASALLELSCSGGERARLNTNKADNASEPEIFAEQTKTADQHRRHFPDPLSREQPFAGAEAPQVPQEGKESLSRKKASAMPEGSREKLGGCDRHAGATRLDPRECSNDMKFEGAPAQRGRKRAPTSFYDPAAPAPRRVSQKETPSVFSREFEIGDQVSAWHS